MNHLKTIFFLLSFFVGVNLSAQDAELLSKVPKKKEFKASKPNLIASVNWIQDTPLDQYPDIHRHQYAMIVGWVSESPTVTVSLNGYLLDYIEKNKDLLAFFMGGWAKFSLQNNYSTDELQCNLAGLRSMINIYKTGKMNSDEKMDSLVKMDTDGTLEDWLKGQLK